MKSTVKILVSVLALGVMASTPLLRAQDDSKAPPPAEGRKGGGGRGGMLTVERIETAVGTLTADQKTKIGDILSKAESDTQALAREDRRTKGREIMTSARKDIRAVLTEEQQKKFDEMAPGRGGKGGKKKQE